MAQLRREAFRDYVQEQGKLTSQVMKERQTEKEWEKNWGFFKQHRNFLEEEALKNGMPSEEYWQTVKMMEAKPFQKNQTSLTTEYNFDLPKTSSGIIGWYNSNELELKNFPTITPPYCFKKQNIIFLG